MSFLEKEIPPSIQEEILKAATPCTWLGRWKLLIITDKNQRVKVVKAWQEDLRMIGRLKDIDWIERWNVAPLFIAFCQSTDFKPSQCELVHFGILGYPKEEVEVTFPQLSDVSFADRWGNPWALRG